VIYCLVMKIWKCIPIMLFFLLFLALSCTSELPYLTLQVESEYTSSDISIPYSFKSEQTYQYCKVELSRTDGSDDSREDWFREEKMEEEGTLNYNGLEPGNYQLRFVVLTDRGSGREELSFLDETYSFSVTY